VKEKRKGPIGRATELAEGFAATVRRMQREREPRVLVYDETGYARLVQPNGRGYERLLETAERMVALVDEMEVEAKPAKRGAAGEPAAGEEDARPATSRRGERPAGDAKARPAKRGSATARRSQRQSTEDAGEPAPAKTKRARAAGTKRATAARPKRPKGDA
jgi:hypothetical protein